MRINRTNFLNAAEEAVKEHFRSDTWPVCEAYEVHELEDGNLWVEDAENGPDKIYRPLVDTPDLFLEFARLADSGEVGREAWLGWVKRYGVLGLGWRSPDSTSWLDEPVYWPWGGPGESLKNFETEALRANWLLGLYESLDSPEGPVAWSHRAAAQFRERDRKHTVFEPTTVPSSGRKKEVELAQGYVALQVSLQLRECYPKVYALPRSGSDPLYAEGWAFYSLLGVMYLQMMWLMKASGEEIRRCKRPGCDRIITFEQPQSLWLSSMEKNDRSMGYRTRKDKEFCSDRCKGLYHYHYRRKPSHQNEISSN
jgi:hypothetical protein